MIHGNFKERDVGNRFYYRETKDEWALKHGLKFEIDFANTEERRFARILKTVAYIAVDENAEGKPVLAKWHITQHQRSD